MLKVPKDFDSNIYSKWAEESIYTKKNTKRSKSLISCIYQRINKYGNKEIKKYFEIKSEVKTKTNVKLALEDRLKSEAVIKNLLLGNPAEISNIEVLKNNAALFKPYFTEGLYPKFRTEFGREINRMLGFRSCPYCNRAFVFTPIRNKEQKIASRYESDHIFPKETYPYLALNIFNLIPVCATCNLTKNNADIDFFNPFEDCWENEDNPVKFKWGYKNKSQNIIPKAEDIDVFIDYGNNNKFKCASEALGLDEIYKLHKSEAIDVVEIAQKYSDSKLVEISKYFDGSKNGILALKKDLLGPNLNPEEFHKRLLAKFIRDIAEDVGFVDRDDIL